MASGHDIQYLLVITASAECAYRSQTVPLRQTPVALALEDVTFIDVRLFEFLLQQQTEHLVKTVQLGFRIEFDEAVALIHGHDEIPHFPFHRYKLCLIQRKAVQL